MALRHNRNFRLLWIGDALSEVGSKATDLAYPLLVLLLTDSPVLAGAVGSAAATANLLTTLPAGALADRWDRRRIMLWSDGARAAVVAALAAVVLADVATWHMVLAVAVVTAAGAALFNPAQTALVAVVVPRGQLQSAFAINQARGYGAGLAGPPAGGALFTVAPAAPFLADAVTYLASFFAVRAVRDVAAPAPEAGTAPSLPIHRSVAEGLRFVVANRLLLALTVQAPLINLAFSGATFTMIVGLREAGVNTAVIGVALAATGVFGLLGSLLAAWTTRGSVWAVLLFVTGIGSVLLGVAAFLLPSPLMALPLTLVVLLVPRANSALMAQIVTITPRPLHGRVFSVLGVGSGALGALAPIGAGLLVAYFGAPTAMLCFAAVLLAAAATVATSSAIRRADPVVEPAEDQQGLPDTTSHRG